MSSREEKLIKYMIISTSILLFIIASFCISRNILDSKNKDIVKKIKIKEKKLNDIKDKNKLLEKEYKKYKDEKNKIDKYNNELKGRINE